MDKTEKPKITSEVQFRRNVLGLAKRLGCDIEVKMIMDRYDNILKQCTNPIERKHIAIMGISEIHKIMDCRGALVVDGQLIIPGEEGATE